MEDLIQYITTFDATFPEQIQGATPAQIQKFTSLIGRSLPSDYAEYLSVMGQNNGGLHFFSSCEVSDLETLTEEYTDMQQDGFWLPEDCILLCDFYPGESLVLRESINGQWSIWHIDGSIYLNVFADSFPKLLWQSAYRRYAVHQFEHHTYWKIERSVKSCTCFHGTPLHLWRSLHRSGYLSFSVGTHPSQT